MATGPKDVGSASTDPSMEDILASIRRILDEEPHAGVPPHAPGDTHHAESLDDVLDLDPTMMVREAKEMVPAPQDEPHPVPHQAPEPVVAAPAPHGEPPPPLLVAPETVNATVSSLGNLRQRLAAERHAAIHRGGPTIEDLVRESLRPLLKDWLDANLPELVERLVRVEIERVIGHMAP